MAMLCSTRRPGIRALAAAAMALALGCTSAPAAVARDEFGSRLDTRRAATGFFRTTRAEGRWWLVDPDGHLFLSLGANLVSLTSPIGAQGDKNAYREAALSQYGSESAWARETVARLRKWGFNTVGEGADADLRQQHIPYTMNLRCSAVWPREQGDGFADVFDPAFERAVRRHVAQGCRGLAEDRWLLGYFTDDELAWGSAEVPGRTLLAQFLGLADEAPGRRRLLQFLARRHLNVEELNAVWETDYDSFDEIGRVPQVGSRIPEADIEAFQQEVAREYFRIVHDAICAADSNHLILGPRFKEEVPRPVLDSMGEYVDVVSVAVRQEAVPADVLREIHRVAGWPILIAEFGPGDSLGAGQINSAARSRILDERAEQYEKFLSSSFALPMVIGVHWFSYVDQWEVDRFGRERVWTGLVGRYDEPHYTLVEAVSRVNRGLYEQLSGVK